jgi:MOSC domain-containing protein YiiM
MALETGQVLSVNVSEKRGEIKHNINEAFIRENFGLETDAHSRGDWHRQVSLLSLSSFDKMRALGASGLEYGVFAENITVEGMDVATLPLQTQLKVGEAILEVTQIGKECHNQGCAIKKQVGTCVMPIEGIFARVLSSGQVKIGDRVEILEKGR